MVWAAGAPSHLAFLGLAPWPQANPEDCMSAILNVVLCKSCNQVAEQYPNRGGHGGRLDWQPCRLRESLPSQYNSNRVCRSFFRSARFGEKGSRLAPSGHN